MDRGTGMVNILKCKYCGRVDKELYAAPCIMVSTRQYIARMT
jgi:hypothetical protein